MWETALAFAIWGGYGSVLTAGHIDPALTAIVRSAILGVLLTAASVVIGRVHRRAKASAFANAPADRRSLGGGWLAERRPPDITTAIPWGSGVLWISGTVMLVDEVLYSVSAVSGPVAIIGLAYGCVPLLTPLLSRLSGTDVAHTMRPRHWICLLVAFIGNAMVFSVLQAAQIHFTMAADTLIYILS